MQQTKLKNIHNTYKLNENIKEQSETDRASFYEILALLIGPETL